MSVFIGSLDCLGHSVGNVYYNQQKSKFARTFYYFNASMEKEDPMIGNQLRFLSFAIGIDEFDERTSFLLN